MPPLLAETGPTYSRRIRPRKRKARPLSPTKTRLDAATVASTLQLQEQQRDLIYSFIALAMKLGFLLIGTASLVKLGIASHQRVGRYAELSNVLEGETARLLRLQERFDKLFTVGGDRRLMDEQDHWIAPDRIRVVWR